MTHYKKLLLIDDDADDHEFFLEAIQEIDSSIMCTTFLEGEKAFAKLVGDEDLPDLIILDTNMPKLSGRQFLAAIKQDPKLKKIPVVMYSTFFSDRDNEELTKLGAAHYLSKPSKFEDFRNALKEILSRNLEPTPPAVTEGTQ